jgi:hypothetical protein
LTREEGNRFLPAVVYLGDTWPDEKKDPYMNLPNADAAAFGSMHGPIKTKVYNGRVDLDVWNGSLHDLVAVALKTRWNPDV